MKDNAWSAVGPPRGQNEVMSSPASRPDTADAPDGRDASDDRGAPEERTGPAASDQLAGPALVLVGPPGAGKSSVGAAAAARLGLAFRDTDHDIEEIAGKPISDVFVEDGEERFRALERDAVERALAEHPGVLALGGGAVLAARTRAALRGRPVVFLSVRLADAVKRVGLARDRPVLAINPRAQLATLLAERRPLYEEIAAVTVETDGRTVEDVTAAVLAALPARAGR